jgi:3-oxoacyl-[acyl-carrier protein] reductase
MKDKVALVMGGGGGIGGAVALSLANEGARVAVADIDEAAALRTVARIQAQGGAAFALQWDLNALADLPGKHAQVTDRLGPIDILFNNSGGPPPSPLAEVSAEAWQQHFNAMVLSLIALTNAVLPGMTTRRWGRVITSASSGVIAPIDTLGVSNALRIALLGWSKTLAREVAASGVTVNVVVPGRIATQRVASLDAMKASKQGRPVDDVSAASMAAIPLGRYGEPHEYADAVAFLASTRASYTTGTVLRVDGGFIPSIL